MTSVTIDVNSMTEIVKKKFGAEAAETGESDAWERMGNRERWELSEAQYVMTSRYTQCRMLSR